MKKSLFDLETQHDRANTHYEEEMKRLRSELVAARRSSTAPVPVPPVIPSPSTHQMAVPPTSSIPDSQSTTTLLRLRPFNDRERDPSEREGRDRQKDNTERDLDRFIDQRDPKRHKSRRDYSGSSFLGVKCFFPQTN